MDDTNVITPLSSWRKKEMYYWHWFLGIATMTIVGTIVCWQCLQCSLLYTLYHEHKKLTQKAVTLREREQTKNVLMQEHAQLSRYTKKLTAYHAESFYLLEQLQTIIRIYTTLSIESVTITRHKGGCLIVNARDYQKILDAVHTMSNQALFTHVTMSHFKKVSAHKVHATIKWHEERPKKSIHTDEKRS